MVTPNARRLQPKSFKDDIMTLYSESHLAEKLRKCTSVDDSNTVT